jgi:hypothetical protein
MIRSIAVIVWALGVGRADAGAKPLPSSTAQAWATAIQRTAKQQHIDPFSLVAIFRWESGLRPGAINKSSGAAGLGQIMPHFHGACKGTADPHKAPTPACRATKARLLDPLYNIAKVGKHITAWRKLCRRLTGRPALFHRWLAGYAGRNIIKGETCGQRRSNNRWQDKRQSPYVRRVTQYRRHLLRQLRRRARAQR